MDHILCSSCRRSTLHEMSSPHSSQAHSCCVRCVSLQTNLSGPQESKVSLQIFFSSFFYNIVYTFLFLGCKVEMFYLNVEAVNTHRDRPLVSQRVHALRHSPLFATKASNIAARGVILVFSQSHRIKGISKSLLQSCHVCCHVCQLNAITYSLLRDTSSFPDSFPISLLFFFTSSLP